MTTPCEKRVGLIRRGFSPQQDVIFSYEVWPLFWFRGKVDLKENFMWKGNHNLKGVKFLFIETHFQSHKKKVPSGNINMMFSFFAHIWRFFLYKNCEMIQINTKKEVN